MSNPEARFLTLDDLSNMPAPCWMIENLFEANSLVMLAGPSYSFKSFLLLDWLLCMASGRSWIGRKTAHCRVGYALGEGKASLLKRINAWVNWFRPTEAEMASIKANFRVTFEVPQMASKASVDNMLADLEKEDFKPEIIAVDTFARSFVGLDENDAKDTGLWIEQADRLRQLGYGVIFLHHTKKNTEFGTTYRGSTAIMGAMDTAMTLTRDENYCTMKVTKQKDHDEGPDVRFRRVIVGEVNGQESCVLVPAISEAERLKELTFQERQDVAELVAELMESADYESDRARARELAKRTGMSEIAAQGRISRANKKVVKYVS